MKCPNCGQWNRATFPRCVKCGCPLPLAARKEAELPARAMEEKKEKAREAEKYVLDAERREEMDPKDRLAVEMLGFQKRKKLGEQRQRELRARGAERGFAPTAETVVVGRRNPLFAPKGKDYDPYAVQDAEEKVDYDGLDDVPCAGTVDGLYAGEKPRVSMYSGSLPYQVIRRPRLFGVKRFLPCLAAALICLAALSAAYFFVARPLWIEKKTIPEEKQVQVYASMQDEVTAHTITIPGKEGAQVYIKELRRSFLITGGVATLTVPDHFWFDDIEGDIPPEMEVQLTPYVRAENGTQKALPPIRYTITVEESPITLLNPSTTSVETSMPVFNISFLVSPNSSVFVNGEDVSSYVNTQNGKIVYNANIQPIGENTVTIRVRSKYYRERTMTLRIFRAVQDIPLELAATMENEVSKNFLRIFATTRPGATITILTPHSELDTSKLDTTGAFSFVAEFAGYGYNTVQIKAQYPGKNDTIVSYMVNYIPNPDDYTRRAWKLDSWGYQDLLANLSARVKNTQVYVTTGVITKIISTQPQLALFDGSDGQGSPKMVMVENQSKTTWEVGRRYRLYADAFGVYDGIPRLIARFTYTPKDPPRPKK